MDFCRNTALSLAVLAATPAVAQPVSAGFAPPIGRDVSYRTIERRNQRGQMLTFTLDQRVRFTRDGDGYRMAVTLLGASSDVPPDMAARFDAAFRPFVGLTTTLRLSAMGKPRGLHDDEATWTALIGAIVGLKKDPSLPQSTRDGLASVHAGLIALPPASRAAMLSENALRLVGFALPALEPGGRIGDPAGGASATLIDVTPRGLVYRLETRKPAPGGAALVGSTRMEVDRQNGLLRRSDSREWLGEEARNAGKVPNVEVTVELLGAR